MLTTAMLFAVLAVALSLVGFLILMTRVFYLTPTQDKGPLMPWLVASAMVLAISIGWLICRI